MSKGWSVLRGWEWTQFNLWNEDMKCNVRMVDTVVLDPISCNPIRWLFTTKQGTIAKKKEEHLSLSAIRDRFLRLSGNTRNLQKHVAYVLYRNGTRTLVTTSQFDEVLIAIESPTKNTILGLQAYVVSQGERQTTLQATYKPGQCLVSAIQEGGSPNDVSPRIRKEVDHAMNEIVQFLQQTTRVTVVKLQAEFVMDEDHVLWLVHVPNAALESSNHETPLQQTQSLPLLGERKADMNAATKCRGEFCLVPASALPGLYPVPPNTPPLEDTGQRYKIANHNVVLARHEMQFLHGRYTDDMAAEWVAVDTSQRTELGRTNPNQFYKQIQVCSNCNRIYAQLQALRQNQFKHAFDTMDERQPEVMEEPPKKQREKKKNVHPKVGPPIPNNNNRPIPSEDLMRFMGVTREEVAAPSLESIQDQQHEAAFLAELAKHSTSTPRRQSTPTIDREDAMASSSTPKSKRKSESKSKSKNKTENQPLLAQFEQEWNQVDSTNRTLLQENHELREKLKQMEHDYCQETQRLRQEVSTAHETNNVLEKQSKQISKRMATMQKEYSDAIIEKDDLLRRRILETEQVCNEQLARMAQASPGITSGRKESKGDQLSLIDTIEQLTAQLEREQREREHDSQRLQAQHQQELARLYERHKVEMEGMRMSVRQGVDSLEELKTQLFASQNQLHVAQTQTKQAKSAIQDLQHQKLQLEDQMAKLEQAAQASSNESKANGAQDMAIEKLNHKIEYLKAQLASEIRCKDELSTTVATLTANIDGLKKERKRVMSEADEGHRKLVERIEERQKQELEMVNSQNATLQSKMVQLQANITDLVADLSIARNKEDNAKLTTEKLAQENVRLNGRIAELELQSEELQETINGTKNSMEDANRANLEATLRRLTHERQYLKNQMEGEVRCKEELELQLKELQAQLQEIQVNSKQEAAGVKQAVKEKELQLVSQLAKLEETQIVLQGELTSTKHQLNEAKLGLFKAREQSHNDQNALETARTDLAHLKASLITAKEELLKDRERTRQSSDRQSKSIQAIKASLVQVEEEKAAAIDSLQSELQSALSKISETQRVQLSLEQEMSNQQAMSRRCLALQRVLNSTQTRETIATCCRWYQWRGHTQTLCALKSQGQKLAETMKARERTWHERMEATCNELTQNAQLEREMATTKLKESMESVEAEKIAQLHAEYSEQLRLLNEGALNSQENARLELVAQHQGEIDQMEDQHANTIHALQEAARNNQRLAEEILEAQKQEGVLRESQLQAEASALLTQSIRDLELAHDEERKHLQGEYERRIDRLKDSYEQKATAADNLAANSLTERRLEGIELCNMAIIECEAKWLKHCDNLLCNQQQTLNIQHDELTASTTSKHAQEVAEVVEHWSTLMTHERTAHASSLQEQKATFEKRLTAELETCRRELLEQKGSAVMATTAKWQRALADTNTRLETEKKVAYDKGVADREAEWQRAANLIKEAQKEEVAKLERDSKEALKACEEKFQLLLEAKTFDLQRDFDTRLAAQVAAANAELEHTAIRIREEAREQTTAAIVAEWEANFQNLKVAHEAELEEACREVEARVLSDCRSASERQQNEWEHDKGTELAKLETSLQGQFTSTLRKEKESWRHELETTVERLTMEWTAKLANETEKLTQEASTQLQERIQACADAAAKQHEEEMNLVQEESEKLIEKVETAMQQLKRQKETTEQELRTVQQALEEAEDASYDLQDEMAGLKKAHVFHHIMLLHHGMRKIQNLEDEIDSKESEHQTQIAQWKQQMDEVTRGLNEKLDNAAQGNLKLEKVYANVYETLVNYKRDELVAHRSASNVVTSELGVLQAQIAEVVKSKGDGEEEIQKAQTELGTLEEEIGSIQLMKDGHVNQAQVARKRRLHQEMEGLLETIEGKRARIRSIDSKLHELQCQHKAKEDEMKGLERQLVQILVEQQKELLQLITSVKTQQCSVTL